MTDYIWEKAQKALGVRKLPKQEPEKKLPLETFPYKDQLYCAKCGNKLMRSYTGGKNRWICSGKERFGSSFCPGVSIPDEVVKSWEFFPKIGISMKGSIGEESRVLPMRTERPGIRRTRRKSTSRAHRLSQKQITHTRTGSSASTAAGSSDASSQTTEA